MYKIILLLTVLILSILPLSAQEKNQEDVLSSLYNPDGGFNLTIEINKSTYYIGEKLNVNFSADEDCYVTLFDINAKNQVTLLYPHTYSTNNLIKKGQKYSLPEKDAEWEWVLGEPSGKEYIIGIATKEPVTVIDDLIKIIKEKFMPEVSKNSGDFFSRTILLKLKNQDKLTWTSSVRGFYLVNTKEEALSPQIEIKIPGIIDGNIITTKEQAIKLTGIATDDKEIVSFKILVNNETTSRAPVVRGKKTFEFNNDIVLSKGTNKITIIVEDSDKHVTTKDIIIKFIQ